MNVLMTADAVGGVWTYALELCRALSVHGVDVALATMGPEPTEPQRAQAERLTNVTLHCTSYRLEWMDDPWDDVACAGAWLLAVAARERIDLVHLNGFAHAALPWRKPVLVVAHSCVYSWWHAVRGTEPPSSSWERYRHRVAAGLNRADVVVAPTRAFLHELHRHYEFDVPSRVISNARTAPLAAARVPAKEPIIFASGRLWDDAKNLCALDLVAPRIAWPIFVAGDARSPDGREARTDVLHCIGKRGDDEVAQWLARASIFVHPAHYEPFGLAVLEAAHAGCALVLSDIATLREIWGDAAIYVDAREPSNIEGALRLLIDTPHERVRLGRLARRRAATLSTSRMGEAYCALYRQLSSGPVRERSVA